MSTHIVGEVRPSQILWTYGPGALIDLPNISVLTLGLDKWDVNRCLPIEEARLLAAVRRVLGSQVDRLRIPPFLTDASSDPFSAESKIGVPVRPFPRWIRCVKCGLLAEYDSGLFEIKPSLYRPERTHFVHARCDRNRGRPADAVPSRFLLACRNGHLDDFPWHWFVHSGSTNCQGTLRFFESGASLQTENLWVKCDGCQTSRSLVHAFGREGRENLPACRGRHPHIDRYDDNCEENARAINLGSTNSWFPVTVSVLAIPLGTNHVDQIVIDGWHYFEKVTSKERLEGVLDTLKIFGNLQGIDKYSKKEIWEAIQRKRKGGTEQQIISESDLKVPEWDILTADAPPSDWPNFSSKPEVAPSGFEKWLSGVLLLERLREVNALIGYTRIEAPEETADPDERPPMATLCSGDPEWVPAIDVRGEGIFIRFKETEVAKWEKLSSVKQRNEKFLVGHRGWRNARNMNPNRGYPGIRYVMLHTFAHLLIRELALECGYNAASIRERIYASTENSTDMAGVLLYTAAADSDGTLGGLVDLGKTDSLGKLIRQALHRAEICSSDPLCSEHEPGEDRSLHAASCHACLFVSETSCERGNRYLDRALLVKTLECENTAFFQK